MVFEPNFLRLTVTVIFQKMGTFHLSPFYFSPTFLKSWVQICDNIAGAVGGPQQY